MNDQLKRRAPLVVGVAAAFAATAWAATESTYTATASETRSISAIEERPAASEIASVPASETLAANETLVASEDDAVPVVDRSVRQPDITVEQKRLTEDERIQQTVMDALARNPRLSGKIGVESHDRVVTLSGYTMTPGQVWRAERDARGVDGVKYVVNEIRPRVGANMV